MIQNEIAKNIAMKKTEIESVIQYFIIRTFSGVGVVKNERMCGMFC